MLDNEMEMLVYNDKKYEKLLAKTYLVGIKKITINDDTLFPSKNKIDIYFIGKTQTNQTLKIRIKTIKISEKNNNVKRIFKDIVYFELENTIESWFIKLIPADTDLPENVEIDPTIQKAFEFIVYVKIQDDFYNFCGDISHTVGEKTVKEAICPIDPLTGKQMEYCLNNRRLDVKGKSCRQLLRNKDLNIQAKNFCQKYPNAQDCRCLNRSIIDPNYKNLKSKNTNQSDYCWYPECANAHYLVETREKLHKCKNGYCKIKYQNEEKNKILDIDESYSDEKLKNCFELVQDVTPPPNVKPPPPNVKPPPPNVKPPPPNVKPPPPNVKPPPRKNNYTSLIVVIFLIILLFIISS